MPLYDYDCAACGRRFEVVHGVHAEGPTVCPICGKGPIRKAIAAPAVHFKGSGWAKKERRAAASPVGSKTSGEGGAADGDAKSSDAAGDSSSPSAPAGPAKPVEPASAGKAD